MGEARLKFSLATLTSTLLFPVIAAAQHNIDLDETGPFQISEYGITHAPLTSWAYIFSQSNQELMAVVDAVTMSASIARASLEIECKDTFSGRTVEFSVGYLPKGNDYPGGEYHLDLFNSVGSGRPAAFNIGHGFIRTDHIKFSSLSGERAPQEYFDQTEKLWRDLESLNENSLIEVRFETRKLPEPYISLTFPMSGFKDVAHEAKDFCPTPRH